MPELEPPSLAEIRAARERVAGIARRTPLVRLNVEDAPAEIHLKLENLQPIGSFKLRATRWPSPRPRSWRAGYARPARGTWRKAWPGVPGSGAYRARS